MTTNRYTTLVSAGCSFANGGSAWPQQLAPMLGLGNHFNFSRPSGGNGLISRGVINLISNVLKDNDPNDLLVVIMWSGSNRYEVFQSNGIRNNITTVNTVNPVSAIEGYENKEWVILNHHWDDVLSTLYYKNFYDEVGSYILTLEHILRTQWYLKNYNIKYVMTTFAPGVLPPANLINEPNIKYLYDLVDFGKFVNVSSCMEWCLAQEFNVDQRDNLQLMHPTREQHILFTKEVLVPFIKNLYKE